MRFLLLVYFLLAQITPFVLFAADIEQDDFSLPSSESFLGMPSDSDGEENSIDEKYSLNDYDSETDDSNDASVIIHGENSDEEKTLDDEYDSDLDSEEDLSLRVLSANTGAYQRIYDSSGYDQRGYNRKGYNKKGYDCEGYDEHGFDKLGQHRYQEFPLEQVAQVSTHDDTVQHYHQENIERKKEQSQTIYLESESESESDEWDAKEAVRIKRDRDEKFRKMKRGGFMRRIVDETPDDNAMIRSSDDHVSEKRHAARGKRKLEKQKYNHDAEVVNRQIAQKRIFPKKLHNIDDRIMTTPSSKNRREPTVKYADGMVGLYLFHLVMKNMATYRR